MRRRSDGRNVVSDMTDAMAILKKRAATAAPRYTSYPTAPNFNASVDKDAFAGWLSDLPEQASLSLYIHIPFCRDLCWFCACRTQGARRTGPVERYLEYLAAEIDAVARLVPKGARVVHMHWGGGSPTSLSAKQIAALAAFLRDRFAFAPEAEIAVEVYPGELDDDKIRALGGIGDANYVRGRMLSAHDHFRRSVIRSQFNFVIDLFAAFADHARQSQVSQF